MHSILVVDDDPKAVEVIAALLPPPAYAVMRAYSGNDAIDMARRKRLDLILLDLTMPGISGFDVVEALRGDAETARIPILVVTAKEVTAFDLAALSDHNGGAIHIVKKAHFNRASFISEVRHALQQ
ncbi:MAG: response regulator [Rhodanobacteraceae bacterium]|nr:response regulator [Rhodanobacteraceae bacterium]